MENFDLLKFLIDNFGEDAAMAWERQGCEMYTPRHDDVGACYYDDPSIYVSTYNEGNYSQPCINRYGKFVAIYVNGVWVLRKPTSRLAWQRHEADAEFYDFIERTNEQLRLAGLIT